MTVVENQYVHTSAWCFYCIATQLYTFNEFYGCFVTYEAIKLCMYIHTYTTRSYAYSNVHVKGVGMGGAETRPPYCGRQWNHMPEYVSSPPPPQSTASLVPRPLFSACIMTFNKLTADFHDVSCCLNERVVKLIGLLPAKSISYFFKLRGA